MDTENIIGTVVAGAVAVKVIEKSGDMMKMKMNKSKKMKMKKIKPIKPLKKIKY